MRIVTTALKGEAAEWMVALYDNDMAELCKSDRFMTVLRKPFEDPLADQKARLRIKTIRQDR